MPSKLRSANTVSAVVTLNINSVKAMFFVNEALLAATHDVFAEITTSARERSPLLDKATTERYPGENRDSIRSSVRKTKKGVSGRIWTTSGFGGWLEIGTKKTPAQPYIYPAFSEHIGELPAALRERLEEISSD